MHYYWYLTNDGIEFLRTYLNLPSEIVPATLKKQAKPLGRPLGGPPGDRPRGPPRFEGERRFGDREGYRGGPRGPGGEFGDKGGAPADYRPSFGVRYFLKATMRYCFFRFHMLLLPEPWSSLRIFVIYYMSLARDS